MEEIAMAKIEKIEDDQIKANYITPQFIIFGDLENLTQNNGNEGHDQWIGSDGIG